MLICETRNPVKAPFIPTSTSATIINVPPEPTPPQSRNISEGGREMGAMANPNRSKTDSSPKELIIPRYSSPLHSKDVRIKIRNLYDEDDGGGEGEGERGKGTNVQQTKRAKVTFPASLSPYYRNAPIKKLSHPLEENIFSSLVITLLAVAVALIIGTPFLFGVGLLFLIAVGIRYSIAVFYGLSAYARYICSNRQHPSSRSQPPQIFPRDRLAFANEVRWLGLRKRSRCQSILHTLLVFEGSMDVSTFRHLIQTRVLRAETPEGELLYPRLLQRLVSVGAGYLWEMDVTFDIQNHIFSGPSQLKGEAQLQQYLGRLLTQEMALSRPLWEIRVLPSYYGGGKDTMAVLRVHQCLADGMSLIRILCHALADHQQMHVPQRPHFAGLSFGFNVLRSLIVGPVTIFLWWFGTFRDRTLFSIPLPKRRRRRGLRCKWPWPFSRFSPSGSRHGKNEEDETVSGADEEDMITFTSSIGSSSSLSSDLSARSSTSSSCSSAKRNSTQQPSSSPSGGDNNPDALPPAPPKPGKGLGFFTRSAKKYKKRCKRRKRHGRRQRRKKQAHSRKRRKLRRRKSAGSLSNSSASLSSGYSRGTLSSTGSMRRFRRPPSWNVVWSAPLSLPKVARIKQIMRSSYNDVLLSAAAGSVRMYLQDQGIPYPGDMQVVIPIDLRNDVASPKISPRLGCKVASVVTTIPSGMESAIPRLWATRHRLDELKSSADSVVAYGATSILLNIFPHRIAIPILESIINKASFQFSNLPGPTFTTVIGGYPLKGIYPIYPPPGSLRAAISVFTYADQVHLTVVTHKSLVNAGPKLLRGITEQVEQLSRQLSQRRVPGESRRSMRHFNQANNMEISKPPTRQIQIQLQVVQEELARLSSRLEAQGITLSGEDYLPIPHPPVPSSSSAYAGGNGGGGSGGYCLHHQQHHHHHHLHPDQSTDELPSTSSSGELGGGAGGGQVDLKQRLKTLKHEFAELIGELRRRSSIVEGIAMSFEEEENEDEYRKPRKRALSVVSMSRRSSIFSSRSNTAPDSPVYSSDEELPSSPQPELRHHPHPQPPSGGGSGGAGGGTYPTMRHASSPMRTTAV